MRTGRQTDDVDVIDPHIDEELRSHLIVYTIAREDMIFAKFWAQVDRREDFNDLIDLAPTSDEIEEAAAQTIPLDGNPNWAKEVDALRLRLRKEMGHDK